ncbi:MAG: HrcA family transcriptional regulator [Terriglobales bacterium]
MQREVEHAGGAGPEGRAAAILSDLIESYLCSGAPVGSRVLAEMHAESPSTATIRHVLAELAEQGYLDQPHTSAGRIPTCRAIRWWLQRQQPPALLDSENARQLEARLRDAADETTLWLRASEFLSDFTQQVGLVVVEPWRDSGLKHIRFLRLTDQRVLAVLVTTDGEVRERICRVPEPYTQPELDGAGRYFNLHFAGARLDRIRRELRQRIEEERAAYDSLLKRVLVLSHCGVLGMQDDGQMYCQGTSHLAALLQGERLGEMLVWLNQKERWLHLLMDMDVPADDVVRWAPAPAGSLHWLRVHVGLEQEQMPEFTLISTNHRHGALGVLGSTRMQYLTALNGVMLVQQVFDRVLGTVGQ